MFNTLKTISTKVMGTILLAADPPAPDAGPAGTTPVQPGTGNSTTKLMMVSNKNELTDQIISIVNGVIAALGFVAVVVMIVGGVNYMTSGGDTGKVTKARNTIIYGLVGLVICVLAFAIVNFVIINIIKGS